MMMMAEGMTTNNTAFGTVGINPPIRKQLVVPRQQTTLDAPNGLTGEFVGRITPKDIPLAFQANAVPRNMLDSNANTLFAANVFQATQPPVGGGTGYKFATPPTAGQATVEAKGLKENNRQAALNQAGVASTDVVTGVGATPWG
jgi:hypothetical protein